MYVQSLCTSTAFSQSPCYLLPCNVCAIFVSFMHFTSSTANKPLSVDFFFVCCLYFYVKQQLWYFVIYDWIEQSYCKSRKYCGNQILLIWLAYSLNFEKFTLSGSGKMGIDYEIVWALGLSFSGNKLMLLTVTMQIRLKCVWNPQYF